MRRQLTAASLVLVFAGFVAVAAQQSATLTLTSGQQLSGELVDLGGVGFTFRVNGQERQIPRGEVRSIDFAGGGGEAPEAARNLAAGTNLAVLRNGETVQGEFYDVSGTQPLRLTFRTSGGERVIPAGEVSRIYLTRADGASASTSGAQASGQAANAAQRTITVPARTAWTPTGIVVRQGQTVRFDASGEIRFSPRNDMARPAGSTNNLFDQNAPLPKSLQGALIGRIGEAARTARATRAGSAGGSIFGIGDQGSIVMPASGMLYLGINDSGLDDNSGEFSVVVAPQ